MLRPKTIFSFFSFLFSSFLFIYFLFLNFLFLFPSFSYFLNFSFYIKSTIWTCKHQFCKLCCTVSKTEAALFSFSVDICVRIKDGTVLSHLVFTLYKLRRWLLLGYGCTNPDFFDWVLSNYHQDLSKAYLSIMGKEENRSGWANVGRSHLKFYYQVCIPAQVFFQKTRVDSNWRKRSNMLCARIQLN